MERGDGCSRNIEKDLKSEWKSGELGSSRSVCVYISRLTAACAVCLSRQRSRSWCGAAGSRDLPGARCPALPLALGSCELLMSIRRKDGSWNSFTRQSYHNGGWVQLQPNAGVHALQHQPEPLPASPRAHVSIPACCVPDTGTAAPRGAGKLGNCLGSWEAEWLAGFWPAVCELRFILSWMEVPPPRWDSSLSLHWCGFHSPEGPIAVRFKLPSPSAYTQLRNRPNWD